MRTTVTFILAMLAGSVVAQTYSGDTWAKVKESGAGNIVLAYVETPSFVYKDNTGKLTGICVDIMNDFVQWANEKKSVKLTSSFEGDGSSFKGMYDKVKGGKGGVFGLGNITITDDRKREVKFSQPFITNTAILITQTSVPTLAKMQDLAATFSNLTAYTAKGTLNEKRMLDVKQKYFPGMKITYTTTSQETLEKVFSDPNGFAYLDMAFYLEALQLKKTVKRHPVGDQAAEQFGLIMPQNSDWGPVLDEFFTSTGYFASSKYKNVLVKHLGEAGIKLMQSVKK